MQTLRFSLLALCLAGIVALALAKSHHSHSRPWTQVRPSKAPPHSRAEAVARPAWSVDVDVPIFVLTQPAAGDKVVMGGDVGVVFTGGSTLSAVSLSLIDVTRWQVADGVTSGIPVESGQYVWTIDPQPWPINTTHVFQLYISNDQGYAYGPTFSILPETDWVWAQPINGARYNAGSQVFLQWTGGLPQWPVGVTLFNATGSTQIGVVGTTWNGAGQLFFTLPESLDCSSEFAFTLTSSANLTHISYSPAFQVTGC